MRRKSKLKLKITGSNPVLPQDTHYPTPMLRFCRGWQSPRDPADSTAKLLGGRPTTRSRKPLSYSY